MGVAERKEREKAALRQKIMDKAIEILINKGIEALSIRKIADAIEYSPRTVYLYFENKDELIKEIIEYGFKGTVEKWNNIDMSEMTKEEIIRLRISQNIQTALNSPNYYKAIVSLVQLKSFQPGSFQKQVINQINAEIADFMGVQLANPIVLMKSFQVFAFIRGFNMSLLNILPNLSEDQVSALVKDCEDSILKIFKG